MRFADYLCLPSLHQSSTCPPPPHPHIVSFCVLRAPQLSPRAKKQGIHCQVQGRGAITKAWFVSWLKSLGLSALKKRWVPVREVTLYIMLEAVQCHTCFTYHQCRRADDGTLTHRYDCKRCLARLSVQHQPGDSFACYWYEGHASFGLAAHKHGSTGGGEQVGGLLGGCGVGVSSAVLALPSSTCVCPAADHWGVTNGSRDFFALIESL